MKKAIYLLAFLVVAGASCKKAIEKTAENIITKAMTDGRWYVEQYLKEGDDITGEFFGYEFQFHSNGLVDGISGASKKTGTWSADATVYTITALFPPSSPLALQRLNYTWRITDSYLDYVEAETLTSTGKLILHLRKK